MNSNSKTSNQQNDSENPFVIKKWKAVGTWTWDVAHDDVCPICKMLLVDRCLGCQVITEEECVIVWGDCNHVFHNCCINVWAKKTPRSKCPVCQKRWIIARTTS
ncbi:hypothetical protein Pmani_019048 [Petrolisthes manimaculis]|uniref:RING-type domain-containing protein n=1 Tax=Petrolisthes manimaculis TaxID=1843537 RepID=A0AAE1PJQ5_9EUCA|nr:hypothetical protein Pmani_019048 [Petrolisthes manimaculis]